MLCGIKKHRIIYRLIKPDRLNALRKQYDFFLEEDKKRKERNEYILGKLDKMVYSNALVPVRTKPTPFVNAPSAIYHLTYQAEAPVAYARSPSRVIKKQLSQDISVKNIVDSYLIQEIGKKYVLIPRLTSPFMNTYFHQTQSICNSAITEDTFKISNLQQPSSNENNDWKRKCEISIILKRHETKNRPAFVSSNKYFAGGDNIMIEDMIYKADYKDLNELPEKNISDEKFKDEINDDIHSSATIAQILDPISHVSADNNVDDEVANIGHYLQETTLNDCSIETKATNQITNVNNYIEHTNDYKYVEPMDSTEICEQRYYEIHPSDDDAGVTNADYNYKEPIVTLPAGGQIHYAEHFESKSGTLKEQLYIENQVIESVRAINSNDLINETNYNQIVDDNGGKDFLYHEPWHNLPPNTDFNMKSSHENIEQGTTSETIPVSKNDEETVDTSIEDFDAEQRDMFYSERPGGGYGYQQDETYNQETHQINSYPQETNYYDEPLHEQVYTGDVNEDDEHLKYKYDQSYCQQYVDPYEKAYAKKQPEYQTFEEHRQTEPVESIHHEQPSEKSD